MNLEERMELHESQVRDLYRTRPALLRKHIGEPNKLKAVEEYIALSEEVLALGNDIDRCNHSMKFLDVESDRGKAQHEEYTRMVESATTRMEEIIPKVDKLKESLGA